MKWVPEKRSKLIHELALFVLQSLRLPGSLAILVIVYRLAYHFAFFDNRNMYMFDNINPFFIAENEEPALKKQRTTESSLSFSCPITLLTEDNFLELGKHLSPVNVAALAFAYPPSNRGLKPFVKRPLELVEWSICEKCESLDAYKVMIEFIEKLFPKLSTNPGYSTARWCGFVRALAQKTLNLSDIPTIREWWSGLWLQTSPTNHDQCCMLRTITAVDPMGRALKILLDYNFITNMNEIFSKPFLSALDYRTPGLLVAVKRVYQQFRPAVKATTIFTIFETALANSNVALMHHFGPEIDNLAGDTTNYLAMIFLAEIEKLIETLLVGELTDTAQFKIRTLLYSQCDAIRLVLKMQVKNLVRLDKLEVLRILISDQETFILEDDQVISPMRIMFNYADFDEEERRNFSSELKQILTSAHKDYGKYWWNERMRKWKETKTPQEPELFDAF